MIVQNMRVIRLNKPGEWESFTTPMPFGKLQKGEALIKVNKIGVCGTDRHAFEGNQPFFKYPRILGHELAVEVMDIADDVTNVSVGSHCCVEPYYNDIIGQAVRRGQTNCGEHLQVLGVHVDGGMQEYFIYPAKFLHPSTILSEDQLVLIEPLAVGKHAVQRAQMVKEDIVLIIGAGPIGLGAILFAKLSGARIIVMDIDDKKLEKCKKITGISETLLAKGDVVSTLIEILNGDLPTVVLDATGNAQSMMNTFNYVAAGGTIVFIGLFTGDVTFNDPEFHKKELTLRASRAAVSGDFKNIIGLMESGKIDALPFITHRIKFDEIPTEFEKLFSSDDLIKAVVEME